LDFRLSINAPVTTTVVIPAYNAGKFLAEAIDSVLGQTYPVTDIIVVDDGSSDDTQVVARSFPRMTYVHQPNGGVASALNHGVRVAKTEAIAFLSADDVWKADKLERQHNTQAGRKNTLVFGHMQHFISPDISPEVAATLVCPPDPMPAFSAGTLLASLECMRAVGPFNESFHVGEFMDWYGRAKDAGVDTIMLEETVSMRRVHGANHSTKTLKTKSYAPVLKALIERRRAQGQKP
jgi:glycosyltransferase involved in cell wall biosynthesis